MVVIKRLGHAVEMSCCCEDDKKVEDLMGVAPDVECARVAPLWPTNLCEDVLVSIKAVVVG